MAEAASRLRHPALRARALQVQGHALKHAACAAAQAADWAAASTHAWQALRLQPGLKWLAYTLWCSLRRRSSSRITGAVANA